MHPLYRVSGLKLLLQLRQNISAWRLLGLLLVASVTGLALQDADFGGTYERLRPEQRKLIDDWFNRYNQRTHKHLTPEAGYNAVPVSVRTTFEAVTHALMTTRLSRQNAEGPSTALDLVQAIETVRGRSPGKRGDLQFRMYVLLKPGAQQILDKSSEFSRQRDNSVFHIGYPVNYRQQPGFPSIQISVSKDGRRADIDVDYRRSGFPGALFNGHLTAANSDVRAGNNYGGHLKRWDGLANWWRNLFGISVERESGFLPEPEHDIANRPRLTAKAKLEDAVHDYLSTWLVQQKPNLAVAYVSASDYACVESYSAEEKNSADVVPRKLWNDLEETNFVLGKPARLSDAVAPVDVQSRALLPIEHKYATEFNLVKVPDDVAAEFNCSEGGAALKPRRKYGTYYGSAFRIKSPKKSTSGSLLLLWRKEQGYWKIVSQQLDPGLAEEDSVPDSPVRSSTLQAPPPETNADPAMIRTTERFFDVLFVKKDDQAAFRFFAPRSYTCVSRIGLGEQRSVSDPTNAAESLRGYLQQIASRSPSAHKLEQILEPFNPDNPTLGVVHHAHEHAYLLTNLPADEASDLLCQQPGSANIDGQVPITHQHYFGSFFKLIEPGEEPAGLGLLWAKENGEWKIIGFQMDEP
jgi:hypothetical protein